jgi:hypothetical protein
MTCDDTGNGNLNGTSEMDDLENFETYQRREVPIEFARRATIEVLRSSVPIARQLIGRVPDMIRDSHDGVSRTYQAAMHPELSPPDLISNYTAPSPSNNPLQNFESQSSVGTANFDLPVLGRPLQMAETGQALGTTNLHSVNQLDPDFLPGLTQESLSGETAPLILELLQNISQRLTRLEQQRVHPATREVELLPNSPLTQQPAVRSGPSSSMAEDFMTVIGRNLNGIFDTESNLTSFVTAANESASMADAGCGFVGWNDEELVFM